MPVIVTPPCSLRARTEQTMTAADGTSPAAGHLMSNSFSAPISEPNPLSVTTYSASLRARRSARTELLPCATFANGPQ